MTFDVIYFAYCKRAENKPEAQTLDFGAWQLQQTTIITQCPGQ